MAARSNALSEITRLWLQTRHGCLVDESIPVPVPYALSDIDIVGIRPDGTPFALPDGAKVGPRLIVETKDEHDWEVTGREFAQLLRNDIDKMGSQAAIPRRSKGVKFTMLREEHFEKAVSVFGSDDFDRLLVVHALAADVRVDLTDELRCRRIHVLTCRELVTDLQAWYLAHPRPAAMRHTITGDIWHLLVGFCGMRIGR